MIDKFVRPYNYYILTFSRRHDEKPSVFSNCYTAFCVRTKRLVLLYYIIGIIHFVLQNIIIIIINVHDRPFFVYNIIYWLSELNSQTGMSLNWILLRGLHFCITAYYRSLYKILTKTSDYITVMSKHFYYINFVLFQFTINTIWTFIYRLQN